MGIKYNQYIQQLKKVSFKQKLLDGLTAFGKNLNRQIPSNPSTPKSNPKQTAQHSNSKHIMARLSFLTPEVSSTLSYLLIGFFILVVIFICVIAFSVMVSLIIISIVHACCHIFHVRGEKDLEAGDNTSEGPRPSQDFDRTYGEQPVTFENTTLENNVQILEMLDRILRHLGEGREGSRWHRRALERLPPRIVYGSNNEVKSSSCSSGEDSKDYDHDNGNDECAICLENFEEGDSCRGFPVCNHIFHSICIGNWLRKNPTCPLCRNCIFGI